MTKDEKERLTYFEDIVCGRRQKVKNAIKNDPDESNKLQGNLNRENMTLGP